MITVRFTWAQALASVCLGLNVRGPSAGATLKDEELTVNFITTSLFSLTGIMVFIGKSSPNGRTIQVGERLQFTHIYIYYLCYISNIIYYIHVARYGKQRVIVHKGRYRSDSDNMGCIFVCLSIYLI